MAIAEQKERYFAMTMKKLFAGLAAAATLLSGLALGVSTANAAPTFGNTITLNTAKDNYLVTAQDGTATTTPRTFKAVKVADYVNTPDTTNGPAVALQTVDGVKNTVTNALKTAGNGSANVYTDADGDPLVWLTKQGDADYRKFVTAIETSLQAQATVTPTEAFATENGVQNTKQLTLTFTEPGLYLIYDQSGDQTFTTVDGKTTTTTVVNKFQTILAGTTINGADPNVSNSGNITTENLDIKGSSNTSSTTKNGFTFHKVNADGNALAGAVFVIKNANNQYGKYAVNGGWTWDANKPAADILPNTADEQKAAGLFVSGQYGSVVVPDLESGTYTVEEIKAPEGYLGKVLPSFTATIANDGKITYNVDSLDQWKLVDTNDTGEVTVKNVKSITQLPLTGAAGTILFSAVGVLLAAAAGTVFLKSRSTKRALRA